VPQEPATVLSYGWSDISGAGTRFAFNIGGKDFDEVSKLRDSIPKEIMKGLRIS
jgi:hypothetical protein